MSPYFFEISIFLAFVVNHLTLSFQPSYIPLKAQPHHMTSKNVEVKTENAPDPLGPYSQAVLAGNTLYCSGNIAIDPITGDIVGNGDVQQETQQVLKNMDAVLKKAGASPANVVRCTVFLDNLENFAAVNEIYAEYFKESPVAPSRSCVQAAALPKGVQVEIDCIAVI
mmetsp:Transcript_11092/g.26647  ORF Transcript_11092/g.26647 Transcript_11092/m.26647 type:complete len:168 (+) Transcript_11092:83-586(+)